MAKTHRRLFVCVDLPSSVIDQVLKFQRELKREDLCRANYIGHEGMHLTLKFIGSMDEHDQSLIIDRLSELRMHSMQARVGAFDYFTRNGRLDIIFLSIISPELVMLVQQIDQLLASIVPAQVRVYVPHVTIARVREVYDESALINYITQVHVEPLEFTIRECILKESQLLSAGAVHRDIVRFALADE